MKTAATRAAIKRASQHARNGMQQIDAQMVDALVGMYTDAANEVRAAIRSKVDASDMVPVNHLRDLLRQIEDVIDNLGARRDALLGQGLESAAALGVKPYTLQGVGATGMPGQAALESAAAMRINQEAVLFVQSFTAADGLKLSDRLWRLNQGAKEALSRAIGQAVVSGWDASRAAAQFMYDGRPVPMDVKDRLGRAKVDALVRSADLLTGDGGEVWKADRVFRTEINRAHGTAYMAGAEKTPGFIGFRFLLSPRHPKPDVCLRAGTLVATLRGPVPIESVQIGDVALTHLGRWRPVVRLYQSSSGQSRLVRLCFPAGNTCTQPVVMTPNHPVLTPGGWIPAGDLRTGSAVVCLGSEAALPHRPHGVGAHRTASEDSGETASASAARTADQGRCGERVRMETHTPRSAAEGSPRPTGLPMFDVAKRLLSCFHPSKPGYSFPCAAPIAIAGTGQSAETNSDAACHSSGYLHRSLGRTQWSNIFAACCSRLGQMTFGMSGTPSVSLRGLCRNTRWSSTRLPVPVLSMSAPQMFFGILGRSPQPAYPAPSIGPHRNGHRTAWWWCEGRAPTGLGWVSAAYRSVRKVWVTACANHIAFTPRHAIVESLPATGEPVYNIEVEDDHSYVANGVVVHNCDLLAAQNLYGLGKGVYPSAKACPWPAHPNTLSFVEMVFADEVTDADRAGKETVTDAMGRMGADVRAGILGVEKAGLYDEGKVKPWMIRSPLYAVKARLARVE